VYKRQVLLVAASICAFMVGRYSTPTRERVIEDTIVYLVENNFVRAKKVGGELEIIPLDEN